MSHARLEHPVRPTLEFRQGVNDEYTREAVANITQQLGTDDDALVHTQSRKNRRTIRGVVSAFKQSRELGVSDGVQALADYADRLEGHLNEFQGDPGYTLIDDQLDLSKNAVLESVQWSLTPGKKYELEYEAVVVVGQGTFESGAIDRRNPTVNTNMDVMVRVDGNPLPGFRDYQVSKEIGAEVKGLFNRDSAENNDVLIQDGAEQRVTFDGVHSGTLAERRQADAELDAIVATENPVTLETRFPGYSLDGFVIGYNSTLEDQRGGNSHRYRLEFVVGKRA